MGPSDIPKIPEGQEDLRVEIEKRVYGDFGDFLVNVIEMYYLLRDSTENLDDGVIGFYRNKGDEIDRNMRNFELKNIVRISPLELVE